MPWLFSSELIWGTCAEMITYSDRHYITIKKAGENGPQERKFKTCMHATNSLNLQKVRRDCTHRSKLGYTILNAASSSCYTPPEQSRS